MTKKSDKFAEVQKALLTAMEPQRAEYETHLVEFMMLEIETMWKRLAEDGGDTTKRYSNPSSFRHSRQTYHTMRAAHLLCQRWTLPVDPLAPYFTMEKMRKPMPRAQVLTALRKQAATMSLEHFGSYASKLSMKIGTSIDSAEVQGALWSNSTLRVVISEPFNNDTTDAPSLESRTEVWTTKMILNRSVYGLLFNQWPTRCAKQATRVWVLRSL